MIEAWHSLHWDFEEKEVPASLKSDVMNYVFEHDKKERGSIVRWLKEWLYVLQKQFTPLTVGLLLLFMGVAAFQAIYNIQLIKERKNGEAVTAKPMEVVSTFFLQGVGQTSSNAKGHASILRQGESEKLVIQVDNLPPLAGDEVYQVWLLNNGMRENAGTFKPDGSGKGMLTYPLAQRQHFDQIGITIEPDQYSRQPRGKKVVGSS
ncbi:anti-sigma factor [Aneurinibacillus sp. REN35]